MINLNEIRDFGPCVSLSEAADILSIEQNTLRAYINRKQISDEYYRKSGSTWLISLRYIEERLEK